MPVPSQDLDFHQHIQDRNWDVQAGSPEKIFDKKMSIYLTKL